MKNNNNTKKIASYVAAAAAFLLTAEADAQIVYTAADLTCYYGGSVVPINMDGDSKNDFNFYNNSGSIRIIVDNSGSGGIVVTSSSSTNASHLNFNATVSISKYFTSTGHLTSSSGSSFLLDGPGYIGVKFNTGGVLVYGWIHIDAVDNNNDSYHIDGYAYESSGGPIKAGWGANYMAKTTGDWGTTTNWKLGPDIDGDYISDAEVSPTDLNSGGIIIDVNITVAASVAVDQCVVNSAGTLTIDSGQTLTISNGTGTDLTNDGTITNEGTTINNGTID